MKRASLSSTDPDEVHARQIDVRAPRYTSYPTADRFADSMGKTEFQHRLRLPGHKRFTQISVYVRIPFRESLCYCCACNDVAMHSRDGIVNFVDDMALW